MRAAVLLTFVFARPRDGSRPVIFVALERDRLEANSFDISTREREREREDTERERGPRAASLLLLIYGSDLFRFSSLAARPDYSAVAFPRFDADANERASRSFRRTGSGRTGGQCRNKRNKFILLYARVIGENVETQLRALCSSAEQLLPDT